MNVKFCLCVAMVLYVTVAHTQIITIKDKSSGEPISFVLLHCIDQQKAVTSDVNGRVEISALSGCKSWTLSHLGYEDQLLDTDSIPQSSFDLNLVPKGFTLDNVVVSATRWTQSARQTPFKIASIGKSKTSLLNPQTAADLLAASGEVYIQKSQQGGGSPMIRGFSTNRLLYAIDGVRMNTAIFRSGNLQNVISLDPFAMERTEVLFGPGSVVYGSDAIGGVMSFSTLTPTLAEDQKLKLTSNAALRYSTANREKTAHVDFGLGGKKLASVSSLSVNDYGDLTMGSHGPESYLRQVYSQWIDGRDSILPNPDPKVQIPTGYKQYNLMQKFRYMPAKNWEIQYGLHHSATSEYSRYDRLIRYRNGLPRYGEWNYGPQRWTMHNLSLAHQGMNAVYDQAVLRAAYQYFEESRLSRDLNSADRLVQTEKVDAWSVSLDFNKKLGSKDVLGYGLEWVTNVVTSLGHIENIPAKTRSAAASRYPASDWSSYAAYATNTHSWNDKWTSFAGLRYSFFGINACFDTTYFPFPYTTADVASDALTGNLGGIYKPNDFTQFSLNLSSGFRSPNVDDLGKVFDSTPGRVTVPNPSLKAETAYNVELAVSKLFGEIIRMDAAVYYTLLRNAMVRRPFTFNGMDSIIYAGEWSGVEAVQNAARARVYGFQIAMEAKLTKGLFLLGKYNFQVGEEELEDGNTYPSRHAAPSFGQFNLNWKSGSFTLQAGLEFMGQKSFAQLPPEEQAKDYLYATDGDGKPYSPSWTIFNVKTMYKVSKHLIASVGIENLTDVRYRPYSSGICAAGRNLAISLRAGF